MTAASPEPPVTRAYCAVSPQDGIGVQETRQGVGIALVEAGERGSVILAPTDARRIAAALLNAADTLDGTVPLVFLPEQTRTDYTSPEADRGPDPDRPRRPWRR